MPGTGAANPRHAVRGLHSSMDGRRRQCGRRRREPAAQRL